jgi:hypothetical protein
MQQNKKLERVAIKKSIEGKIEEAFDVFQSKFSVKIDM